jgi:hypothetical protein
VFITATGKALYLAAKHHLRWFTPVGAVAGLIVLLNPICGAIQAIRGPGDINSGTARYDAPWCAVPTRECKGKQEVHQALTLAEPSAEGSVTVEQQVRVTVLATLTVGPVMESIGAGTEGNIQDAVAANPLCVQKALLPVWFKLTAAKGSSDLDQASEGVEQAVADAFRKATAKAGAAAGAGGNLIGAAIAEAAKESVEFAGWWIVVSGVEQAHREAIGCVADSANF